MGVCQAFEFAKSEVAQFKGPEEANIYRLLVDENHICEPINNFNVSDVNGGDGKVIKPLTIIPANVKPWIPRNADAY